MQQSFTLDVCEPLGLPVVLGGEGERVDEHEEDDQPIESLRFDDLPAFDLRLRVQLPPPSAVLIG